MGIPKMEGNEGTGKINLGNGQCSVPGEEWPKQKVCVKRFFCTGPSARFLLLLVIPSVVTQCHFLFLNVTQFSCYCQSCFYVDMKKNLFGNWVLLMNC